MVIVILVWTFFHIYFPIYHCPELHYCWKIFIVQRALHLFCEIWGKVDVFSTYNHFFCETCLLKGFKLIDQEFLAFMMNNIVKLFTTLIHSLVFCIIRCKSRINQRANVNEFHFLILKRFVYCFYGKF